MRVFNAYYMQRWCVLCICFLYLFWSNAREMQFQKQAANERTKERAKQHG